MTTITNLTELSTDPGESDVMPIVNLAAPVGSRTKKTKWSTLKAALKTVNDALYAAIGNGVTGGNSHSHSSGDGAQIAYDELSGLPTYINYADRGDPSDIDFSALTTDASWHDLDLSAIVPSGAKAVILRVYIQDDAVGTYLAFRKKGNSNGKVILQVFTQATNAAIEAQGIVPCSTARVVQYTGSNTAFSDIRIVILGWFI